MTKSNDKSGKPLAQSKTTHTRALKVRKGHHTRTVKDRDHVHFDQTVYTTVPWINLQGQWLEKAGFAINTPLKVRVMEGCLVVTVEGG